MKNKVFSHLIVLAAALSVAGASAADKVRLRAVPGGGSMKIVGTSTIHDWHASTKLLGGSFSIAADFPVDKVESAKKGKIDAGCTVMILASSFASSSGAAMDKVMRKAMNTSDYPTIRYSMTAAEVKDKAKDGGITLGTTGMLTVSGKKKEIVMDVVMKNADGGKVSFSGSTKVKMTDFGIKPPSPAISLGLIKTEDEVTLEFTWNTKKAE